MEQGLSTKERNGADRGIPTLTPYGKQILSLPCLAIPPYRQQ